MTILAVAQAFPARLILATFKTTFPQRTATIQTIKAKPRAAALEPPELSIRQLSCGIALFCSLILFSTVNAQPTTNAPLFDLCHNGPPITVLSHGTVSQIVWSTTRLLKGQRVVEQTCVMSGPFVRLTERAITNVDGLTSVDDALLSWTNAIVTFEIVYNENGFYRRYLNVQSSKIDDLERSLDPRSLWDYFPADRDAESSKIRDRLNRLPISVCAYSGIPDLALDRGIVHFSYQSGKDSKVLCAGRYDINSGLILRYEETSNGKITALTDLNTNQAASQRSIFSIDQALVRGTNPLSIPAGVGGVGIILVTTEGEDFMTVVKTLDGSSAQEIGLHAGDRLVAVDGESVAHLKGLVVLDRLRGPPNTSINATFDRHGELFTVTLERRILSLANAANSQ